MTVKHDLSDVCRWIDNIWQFVSCWATISHALDYSIWSAVEQMISKCGKYFTRIQECKNLSVANLVDLMYFSVKLNGCVKETNTFHNYETEKINHKASDVAENLQLYRVDRFFRPRLSCMTHLMLFSECPPIYVSCMTILGGRTEQHVIIAVFLSHHWHNEWFLSAENIRLFIYVLCMMISGERTEQHVITGFEVDLKSAVD